MPARIHPRTHEIGELVSFLNAPSGGFAYVRGRRRVGKSWILQKVTERCPGRVIFYTGKKDLQPKATLREFAMQFDEFAGGILGPARHDVPKLSEFNSEALTWERVFRAFAQLAAAKRSRDGEKSTSLGLFFEEIQWVASKSTGIIGALKSTWDALKEQNIKIILCGSSNKFFEEHTGDHEKTLRGLKTHADIWVLPLTLAQTRAAFFPNWTLQEAAVVQMCFGGIPYYLENIPNNTSFVLAINEAAFLRRSLFLEEAQEILALDFNAQRRERALHIIEMIPPQGCGLDTLVRRTGFPQSNVSEIVEVLERYGFVSKRPLPSKGKRGGQMKLVRLADQFLMFYAAVLAPRREAISANNTSRNIFATCIGAKLDNYYIADFTGSAFELLVENELAVGTCEHNPANWPKIYARLGLTPAIAGGGYKIQSDVREEGSQIDLLIIDSAARLAHLIECKWGREDIQWINLLRDKPIPTKIPDGMSLTRSIVCGYPTSSAFKSKAAAEKIAVMSLEDLIG